jgi:Zn-finger nucleic acid-binding protein
VRTIIIEGVGDDLSEVWRLLNTPRRWEKLSSISATVCQGIWLDLGELSAVIDFQRQHPGRALAADAPAAARNEVAGPCPRCGGEGNMTRITSLQDSSLVMDSCPVCYGIWLDGGELQRLMNQGAGFSLKRLLPQAIRLTLRC